MSPMAPDQHPPSLCVYVEEREPGDFLAWVERSLGPCRKRDVVPELNLTFYDVQVPWSPEPMGLRVTEKMDPLVLTVAHRGYGGSPRVPPDSVRDAHPIPITELEFVPTPPLWTTHAALGRQLSRELGVDVLCSPPPEHGLDDHSDVWLFIRGGREELLLL